MKNKLLQHVTLLAFLSFHFFIVANCYAQKVKITKKPVVWNYKILPLNPLDIDLKTKQVIVYTEMDPLNLSDRTTLNMARPSLKDYKEYMSKARQDTINKWVSHYLSLNGSSIIETSKNADIIITLTTEVFKIDNIQLDIDYSDNESFICEINVSARLSVKLNDGESLLDENIPFRFEDSEGETTYLKLKHLVLNPTFKTRLRLTKNPEKKRKVLKNKLDNYEKEILEYFFMEAEKILEDNYLEQIVNASGAVFSVKDKAFDEINDMNEKVAISINRLTALSKKKKLTLLEIKPTIKSAINTWENALKETTNPEIQKLLNANLALGYLFNSQIDIALSYLNKIPESKELNKGWMSVGSFRYYIGELLNAVFLMNGNMGRIEFYTW